jgi:pyruvate/2-oxoglutarate/acetoin dehydrogenase E1 component
MKNKTLTYANAILEGFVYLLENYPEVFVIGQGLWSPWYVGNTMQDLDKKFGKSRVIDSPVSESACTGAAVGASLYGYKPIVVHPRMDFMLYAIDSIVNQAAKWSHMFGGQANPSVTIRSIINRGGEQGAQHSQALHSWFAHVPGLRVVMPASVSDARDLLIASVLSSDPVMFIDDRWLYDRKEELSAVSEIDIDKVKPKIVREGTDITLVGAGFTTYQCEQVADSLSEHNISSEVIDLRVLNPLDPKPIIDSVAKTKRLCAIDGGWATCGIAGEIIASVCEEISPYTLVDKPLRITLPNAPAPTSKTLEQDYYPNLKSILVQIRNNFKFAKAKEHSYEKIS